MRNRLSRKAEDTSSVSGISRIYLWAKAFVPHQFAMRWKKEMRYAGFDTDPEEFAGFMLVNGFLIAVLASIVTVALKFSPIISIGSFFFGFIASQLLIDIVLRLLADSRAHVAEYMFPDVLILMSSNIRAGMTPDRALTYSVREEFGPLAEELSAASRKTMTGADLGDVLLEVTEGIKSNIIRGSIQLIVEGIRGGGEIGTLMEETARDIRNMELLRDEIRAQVRTYSLFILFAAIFGSPALFSVSVYLASTLTKITPMSVTDIPAGALSTMPFMTMKPVKYDPNFLRNYCILSIAVVSISASLLIGLIEQGNELRGLRYIPLLLLISWGIFFFVTQLVSGFTGSITGWVA